MAYKMDPNTEYIVRTLITIFITLSAIILSYFRWRYRYWFTRNMPFLEPKIPFGNTENPLRRTIPFGKRMQRYYESFKQRGHKHGGVFIFTRPVYVPVDPEYVKNILISDFAHFQDRGGYVNEKDDPLSAHLFSLNGARWKNLRAKLTPAFSSGKMKMMYPTLLSCAEPMIDFIKKCSENNTALDVKTTMSAFTTDVIGSCAFGIDCNSFVNPDSEFIKYGGKIFQPNKLRAAKGFFVFTLPKLAKKLKVAMIPKDISTFYKKVVKETIEYRETNDVTRNDFMQILLELKNNKDLKQEQLTVDEISAQAFLFFLAGFETSSTTLTFCLLELAQNPDIQTKLRQEVLNALKDCDGKLTYNAVMEMKYMTQVIEETLRKYPPAVMLNRKCINDYPIPNTDFVLEKGTTVMIPVYGIHHDPEYYPDPDKFDPDRFTEENKQKRPSCTFIPFGEGPRICIGIRFGMMEMKIALSEILKNYILHPSDKTKYPLEFSLNALVLSSKETIYLNVKKIE